MIILPSTPSGITIFCDDIRHEVTGKLSLIGVYESIASGTPIVIPQLCMITKVRLKQSELPFLLSLKIIFEDEEFSEEIIQEMELNIPAVDAELLTSQDVIFSDKEGITYAQFQTQTSLINFPVSKSGRIKVRMFDGDNQIALGALRILIAPQSNT